MQLCLWRLPSLWPTETDPAKLPNWKVANRTVANRKVANRKVANWKDVEGDTLQERVETKT